MWAADVLAVVMIFALGAVCFFMQQCVRINKETLRSNQQAVVVIARHTVEVEQLTEVVIRANKDNSLQRQLGEAVVTLTGEVLRLHRELS